MPLSTDRMDKVKMPKQNIEQNIYIEARYDTYAIRSRHAYTWFKQFV